MDSLLNRSSAFILQFVVTQFHQLSSYSLHLEITNQNKCLNLQHSLLISSGSNEQVSYGKTRVEFVTLLVVPGKYENKLSADLQYKH